MVVGLESKQQQLSHLSSENWAAKTYRRLGERETQEEERFRSVEPHGKIKPGVSERSLTGVLEKHSLHWWTEAFYAVLRGQRQKTPECVADISAAIVWIVAASCSRNTLWGMWRGAILLQPQVLETSHGKFWVTIKELNRAADTSEWSRKGKIWPYPKSVYYPSFNQHGFSQILQQSDFAFQASSIQSFICSLHAIFTHPIWKAESRSLTPPMRPLPTIP